MKLYIKLNDIETFNNIEFLLKGRFTLFKKFLTKEYPIEYKANIQTLENLQNRKDLFFTQKDIRKEIKGIYFGNDSCEHLIPQISQIQEVLDYCKSNKLNFALVLPPLSEFSIKKVEKIFEFLKDKKIEVVVNDFGALNLAKNYKNIKIIAGITFNKLIKPAFIQNLTENQQNLIQQTEIQIQEYREFFKDLNITRFSFENVKLDFSFLLEKPYITVDYYYPFIRISYSKACNIAGLFNNIQNYFPVNHCPAYCKDVALEMEGSYEIFQRYYCFYKINTDLNIPKEIFNRLIWEVFL